jgi:hypothetical protein
MSNDDDDDQAKPDEQEQSKDTEHRDNLRAIREDRQRSQAQHGKHCTCWRCKGN